MRRNELDFILGRMLESQQEVSDLNFTADKPLQVESFGELVPVDLDPPIASLTPFQTEMVALNLIGGSRRLTEELLRSGSCDSSYSVSNKARFRVNIFSQRGNYSVVLRKLNTKVPTLEELSMPDIFHQVAKEKTGLVLVTGATGSGKTTTLAALLNQINESKSVHVITLEDPVEFVHPQKRATFNQRELGSDFNTFASGLRAALRQAPKVILVGECAIVKRSKSASRQRKPAIWFWPPCTRSTRAKPSTVSSACSKATNRSRCGSVWPTRCAGSSASAWCRKSAAVARLCWKSWVPISAPKKVSNRAKAKERPSTKLSRPAIPSAGARSTTPLWKRSTRA